MPKLIKKIYILREFMWLGYPLLLGRHSYYYNLELFFPLW
jgi:hypothetical protein